MEKQPSLRAPLREYLAKKAGAHQNARNTALLELLAEPDGGAEGGPTAVSTPGESGVGTPGMGVGEGTPVPMEVN